MAVLFDAFSLLQPKRVQEDVVETAAVDGRPVALARLRVSLGETRGRRSIVAPSPGGPGAGVLRGLTAEGRER